MAVLPAGCPFCARDDDRWLLSGAHPNPGGTVTRDLLAYTGCRLVRVARIPGAAGPPVRHRPPDLARRAPLRAGGSAAAFKLLAGNPFTGFLSPAFSASGMTPIAAGRGGEGRPSPTPATPPPPSASPSASPAASTSWPC